MDRDKWGLTALYLDDIESGQPSHLTRTADVSAWRAVMYHHVHGVTQ